MARNLLSIKKRIGTITSTQKITNAMRLVSISKLQQFKKKQDTLFPYFQEVVKMVNKLGESEKREVKTLYVVVAPDLGLVSAYTNGLLRYVTTIEKGDFVWIGTQGYELAQARGLNIINEKTTSDDLDLEHFVDNCQEYLKEYHVHMIIASYQSALSLTFNLEKLDVKLKKEYDVIYRPNYDDAALRFREIALNATLYYGYYAAKFSEFTTRRIAMETATNNADDMIDELRLIYNRVRQEAITQEIAELVSGMEG